MKPKNTSRTLARNLELFKCYWAFLIGLLVSI